MLSRLVRMRLLARTVLKRRAPRRPRRRRRHRRKAARRSSDRTKSSRTGRSRFPTVPTASSTTAGPGDRSARSTPKRPTASGSRSAASCRCRRARSRGRRTACSIRPAATPPATTTASARRASRRRSAAGSGATTTCIFVVDRDGKMVAVVAAARQAVRGDVRARAAQDQDEPVRSREARLGDRRPAARDLQVHLRRQARDDARHEGQARTRRRQAVRPADRHRLAARRDVLHQRRLRRHARREVRQGRQVPDGLGRPAEGSEESRAERVQHGPQHPDQQGRRLFVVDRGHRRIQVFDENGKFLDMWTTGVRSSPYAHLITTDQFLWVSDGGTNRILKYDLNGKYLYGWGGPGGQPGSSTARTRSRPIRTATCISPKCSTAACRSSGRSRAPIRRRSSARSFAIRRPAQATDAARRKRKVQREKQACRERGIRDENTDAAAGGTGVSVDHRRLGTGVPAHGRRRDGRRLWWRTERTGAPLLAVGLLSTTIGMGRWSLPQERDTSAFAAVTDGRQRLFLRALDQPESAPSQWTLRGRVDRSAGANGGAPRTRFPLQVLDTGHLVDSAVNGDTFAPPFDVSRMALTGPSAPLPSAAATPRPLGIHRWRSPPAAPWCSGPGADP